MRYRGRGGVHPTTADGSPSRPEPTVAPQGRAGTSSPRTTARSRVEPDDTILDILRASGPLTLSQLARKLPHAVGDARGAITDLHHLGLIELVQGTIGVDPVYKLAEAAPAAAATTPPSRIWTTDGDVGEKDPRPRVVAIEACLAAVTSLANRAAASESVAVAAEFARGAQAFAAATVSLQSLQGQPR